MTVEDLYPMQFVTGKFVRQICGGVKWQSHYSGQCQPDDVDRVLSRLCVEGEKLGANAIVCLEVQFDPFAEGGCMICATGLAVAHWEGASR